MLAQNKDLIYSARWFVKSFNLYLFIWRL